MKHFTLVFSKTDLEVDEKGRLCYKLITKIWTDEKGEPLPPDQQEKDHDKGS